MLLGVIGGISVMIGGALLSKLGEYQSYYGNMPSSALAVSIAFVLVGVALFAGGIYLEIRKRQRKETIPADSTAY